MLKTNGLTFIIPFVKSASRSSTQIPTKNIPVNSSVIVRPASRSSVVAKSLTNNIQIVSAVLVGIFMALLVLHVYWINTYSAKGFELKRAQNAIEEQTAMQKKLLVQQSLLSSTTAISNAQSQNLVPITEVEYVAGSSYAQAK